MKNLAVIQTVSNTLSRTTMKLQKHSPEILVVTGVVGVVASAVMACKATAKLSQILDDTQDTMDKIRETVEDESMADRYTEEDAKKDTTIVYVQTGIKIAKLYAPSIILGVLSITSILASNSILRKRNVALAAAYTAIDNSFKEYRNRVVERFGEIVDRELKYNIKQEKIEEMVTDEQTGKEKKVKKTIEIADPNTYSDYARFFDDGCTGWEKDPEYNLMFLRAQQRYANDLLKTRGHLFLNEVYDMLGIERTKAGQVVGWVYNPEHPIGDNYVDFGIYDIHRTKARDFVNGYENVILLDFNVDGNIWDLI